MIPRLNDFFELATLLNDTYSGMDISNMTIEFALSPGILQKINEELFYRNNGENSIVYGKPEETDEVNINIGNIKFRCVKEKNESE
jgi:hypothetical protein